MDHNNQLDADLRAKVPPGKNGAEYSRERRAEIERGADAWIEDFRTKKAGDGQRSPQASHSRAHNDQVLADIERRAAALRASEAARLAEAAERGREGREDHGSDYTMGQWYKVTDPYGRDLMGMYGGEGEFVQWLAVPGGGKGTLRHPLFRDSAGTIFTCVSAATIIPMSRPAVLDARAVTGGR